MKKLILPLLLFLCGIVGTLDAKVMQDGWRATPNAAIVRTMAVIKTDCNKENCDKSKPINLGTGTIIDRRNKRAYVLTCSHLLQRGGKPVVQIGMTRYAADIKYNNKALDVLILCIIDPKIEPIKFSKQKPKVGEFLWGAGYGKGRYHTSKGQFRRYLNNNNYLEMSGYVIQGDSGGPILNKHGNIVGMITRTNYDGTVIGPCFPRLCAIIKAILPPYPNRPGVIIPKRPIVSITPPIEPPITPPQVVPQITPPIEPQVIPPQNVVKETKQYNHNKLEKQNDELRKLLNDRFNKVDGKILKLDKSVLLLGKILVEQPNLDENKLVGKIKKVFITELANHYKNPEVDPRKVPLWIYLTEKNNQNCVSTNALIKKKIKDGINIRVVILKPTEVSVYHVPRLVAFPSGKVIRGELNVRKYLADLK